MNTSKKYITYSDLTEETLKSKQRLDLIDFEKSQKESLRLFKEAQTRTLQNSQELKEKKTLLESINALISNTFDSLTTNDLKEILDTVVEYTDKNSFETSKECIDWNEVDGIFIVAKTYNHRYTIKTLASDRFIIFIDDIIDTKVEKQSLKEAKKFCQMHYQESINRPTLEDSGWTPLNDRIFSVDTSKHVYTIEKINNFTFQIYVSNKTLPIKCASTLKAAKEWCEIHWQSS